MISPAIKVLKTKNGVSANKVNFNKKKDKCVIMGNGPSLKKDLPMIVKDRESADFFCVNAFPLAEQFFEIKPEFIVLTDTAWWREDPSPENESKRKEVYNILNKVDWKLQCITTHNSDYSFMRRSIGNKNIEITKLNTVSILRLLDEHAFKYYDTGYFAPPFDNVLLIAVYTAIKAGYSEIEIYGADLSYMFLIDVDQDTNMVFIKEEHFHENGEREVLKMDAGINSEPATMHDFLKLQATILKGHELLNEYAKSKGVKIKNKSSYSIIDAYSRQ